MKRYTQGFTLMELIMTVAVIGIIGVTIGTFQKNILSLGSSTQSGLEASDQARRILRPMADYLRSAVQGENGGYPIISASETELVFYADYDQDDVVERVRFYLSGGTIYQGIIEPTGAPVGYTDTEVTRTLIEHVTSTSIFTFFDTNYDGTTASLVAPIDVTAVRLVKIDITADKDPLRSPPPISVSTQVVIRTIKDNL